MSLLNPETNDPLIAVRRNKILNSAQTLFAELGPSSTTLERIAAHCGLSKSAVYRHFRSPEEAFKAVASRLAGQIKNKMITAFEQRKSLWERIAAALIAKHELVFDVVRSSAYSRQLFSAQIRIAEDPFLVLDSWIQEQIKIRVASLVTSDEEANELAFMIFSASMGISSNAATAEQGTRAIERLCRMTLNI